MTRPALLSVDHWLLLLLLVWLLLRHVQARWLVAWGSQLLHRGGR